VADLSVTAPCAGLGLPLVVGDCRLDALEIVAIWSIAPYPGEAEAVAAAMGTAEMAFPGPGKVTASGAARAIWAGRQMAFLTGGTPPEDLARHAAITDQSDGWAGLSLAGEGAAAVLTRLLPLDLRQATFPVGASARSLLNHMPSLVVRTAATAFELYIYRSMAATAVHELSEAMRGVAAREAIR
jgi:heterotetrameric sarcosine oxidase gamma subunit